MHLNHKQRWIFSPLVMVDGREQPLAREYALLYEAPMHVAGFALTHCVMNSQQLAAAKKDPRLVVLPTVHARETIPAAVASHHAAHGVKPEMLLHEALSVLAAYHPNFEPEE